MGKRRDDEAEEELQPRLLDVSEDPAFGKPAPLHKGVLIIRDRVVDDRPGDTVSRKDRVLH